MMRPSLKLTLSITLPLIIIIVASFFIYQHSTIENNTTNTTKTNAIVLTKYNQQVGNYLTDLKGRTLYQYNKDSNSLSSCFGACIVVWPPYQTTILPKNLPKGFSYVKRSDTGQYQYVLNGKPLYYYQSDAIGEIKGNSIGGFSIVN